MSTKNELVQQIADARKAFIDEVSKFSEPLSKWKASEEEWCATEIIEHLFWAEQGGVLGMWKSLNAHRHGKKVWEGEEVHEGLTIEEVVDKTWKSKETVPPVAAPRMGGPITFWIISLSGLQNQLDALGKELTDDELKIMTQPHPISGPLNMRQRFEFLRFHLDRHKSQVIDIYKRLVEQNIRTE